MALDHTSDEIVAAGGIVIDRSTPTPRVLLVHRPKYDDWSLPKGKASPGESIEETALREVVEETGVRCTLIKPLTSVRYTVRDRDGAVRSKLVHYFLMETDGNEINVDGSEVDVGGWFDLAAAEAKLSYERDREILRAAMSSE